MHERDKERGERDYVKGNQLCFCLKRWKTITVKRIVFINFDSYQVKYGCMVVHV